MRAVLFFFLDTMDYEAVRKAAADKEKYALLKHHAFINGGNCFLDSAQVCLRVLACDYDWLLNAKIPSVRELLTRRAGPYNNINSSRRFAYLFQVPVAVYNTIVRVCGIRLLGVDKFAGDHLNNVSDDSSEKKRKRAVVEDEEDEDDNAEDCDSNEYLVFCCNRIYETQLVDVLRCSCFTFLCDVTEDDMYDAKAMHRAAGGHVSVWACYIKHPDCIREVLDRIVEVKPYMSVREYKVQAYVDSCISNGGDGKSSGCTDLSELIVRTVQSAPHKVETLQRLVGVMCQSLAKHRDPDSWWLSRFHFTGEADVLQDRMSLRKRVFVAWRYCANNLMLFRAYEYPRKRWDVSYPGGLIKHTAGTYAAETLRVLVDNVVGGGAGTDGGANGSGVMKEEAQYYAVQVDATSMYPNTVLQFDAGYPLIPWLMRVCLCAREKVLDVPEEQKSIKDVMCRIIGYLGTSTDTGMHSPLSWCVSKSVASIVTCSAHFVMSAVDNLIRSKLSNIVRPPVSIVTDSLLLVAVNGDGLTLSQWRDSVIGVINSKFVVAAVLGASSTSCRSKKQKLAMGTTAAAGGAKLSRFIGFRPTQWYPYGVIVESNGIVREIDAAIQGKDNVKWAVAVAAMERAKMCNDEIDKAVVASAN